MQFKIHESGESVIVGLAGDVTIEDRQEFDNTLIPRLCRPGVQKIVVNLQDGEYMDSAGLGMLLALRKRGVEQSASIILQNPTGAVAELLELARFDTLFSIQQ